MTHRDGTPFVQADNSLPPNPSLPQGLKMLNPAVGVDGWVAEGAPEDYGTLDRYYSTLLDQIGVHHRAEPRASSPCCPTAPPGRNLDSISSCQERRAAGLQARAGSRLGGPRRRGSARLAVWPEEGVYPRRSGAVDAGSRRSRLPGRSRRRLLPGWPQQRGGRARGLPPRISCLLQGSASSSAHARRS